MFASAFIFGLLSSLHCVGMCGPIAFALPVHKGTAREKWFKISAYHLGRLFTYATIGVVFGLFGRAFVLAGLQQTLSIVAGAILIVIALFQKKVLRYLEQKSTFKVLSLFKNGYQRLAKSKSLLNFFSLGMLNGLLPCGTLYVALIGAIALGTAWEGGLYLFIFGLGTLPLMFLFMGIKLISTAKFKAVFNKAVPVMLLVVGVMFVLRGLGLGIAFVSPSDLSLQIHLVPVGCH
ncbi:sulfite exporter TauE/SafE family protein [Wenyingzhuangia sp. 2_MG-2023]|uniref:sulfite exporter TauE/SafE family protein n=1 Tax=Wenyingzhuangia sp. 2_MG-2023 TaxID=3062639 RepID=UPI0026E1E8DE|nr:sulfite exporter TauE/SafE family protein [Wenyingzhuangia sp. 2_MG-2023]MDO6738950.1 sulfite exporter TauE/SafE family protein [Wenyingzhuangia sp. 2_MG-2023]